MDVLFAVCTLLGVTVVGCDPRARVYEDAVRAVPPAHWRLVTGVIMDPTTNGQYLRRTGQIRLPTKRRDRTLYHEVGHAVGERRGLYADWEARFWDDDTPRGETVSRYARTKPREDFAETMEHIYQRDDRCGVEARIAWLEARIPEIRGWSPPCRRP